MSNSLQQTIRISAPVDRVYQALANSAEHAAMTKAPASFHAQEGASFECHGGQIVGRFVELVENRRIVQAWRPANWPAGVYSLVTIHLEAVSDAPSETELKLEHAAIPMGMGAHLEQGWHRKYWTPLKAYLAKKTRKTGSGSPEPVA